MSVDRRSFLRNLAGLGGASAAAALAAGVWSDPPASAATPIRPPGALPEDAFTSTCIRCMRCVDACPNHAIVALPADAGSALAGTPNIRPREQACMLCAGVDTEYLRCTAVCPSGALQPVLKTYDEIRQRVRMGVARIDRHLCYSYNNYTCGACHHACPLRAIHVGLWERPTVRDDLCVGCGLCERVCFRYPQAIRVEPVERPDPRGKAPAAGERSG